MSDATRLLHPVPIARLSAALLILLAFAPAARAQVAGGVTGGTTGTTGTSGTSGTTGTTGTTGATVGGVYVDPEGVVRAVYARDDGALDKKRRLAQAEKELPAGLNSFSPCRKLSLSRLEKACRKYADKMENVPAELQYLGGLQRIDYIFVYPEEKEIVIAGPAEGFAWDKVGRAVGLTTGRPPLRLDDLFVAFRVAERGGDLGCSIDPKAQNLVALNQWIAQNGNRPATSADSVKSQFPKMAQVLGMQDVRIFGVPAESHFAQVVVEADYRMKRLAIGAEVPPVKGFRSHLSMTPPGANSMQRWWFTPLYEKFVKSDDGLAYQIVGPRAQLLSQDELVSTTGQRSNAAFTQVSTQKFAQQFTAKFPELADKSPIFAELQSVFDLAVLAALLKKEQLPQRIGWNPGLFLDEAQATIVKCNVPRQVMTVATSRSAGKRVIGMLGGGVTIDPFHVIASVKYEPDGAGTVEEARKSAEGKGGERWWWD